MTGRTTTLQTGNALSFDALTISGAISGSFGGGQAVLNGNTFTGTGSYNSASCGVANSVWTGFFSGDGRIMNLRVVITPTSTVDPCAVVQFLGEVSR